MWTAVAWVIIMMQTGTFFRLSFALRPVVSPVAEQVIRSDDRGTGGTGGHFSDDRYLGTHRADKGAFYVWSLDPLLPHHPQRRMSCSWVGPAFVSVAVNTDLGVPD